MYRRGSPRARELSWERGGGGGGGAAPAGGGGGGGGGGGPPPPPPALPVVPADFSRTLGNTLLVACVQAYLLQIQFALDASERLVVDLVAVAQVDDGAALDVE